MVNSLKQARQFESALDSHDSLYACSSCDKSTWSSFGRVKFVSSDFWGLLFTLQQKCGHMGCAPESDGNLELVSLFCLPFEYLHVAAQKSQSYRWYWFVPSCPWKKLCGVTSEESRHCWLVLTRGLFAVRIFWLMMLSTIVLCLCCLLYDSVGKHQFYVPGILSKSDFQTRQMSTCETLWKQKCRSRSLLKEKIKNISGFLLIVHGKKDLHLWLNSV